MNTKQMMRIVLAIVIGIAINNSAMAMENPNNKEVLPLTDFLYALRRTEVISDKEEETLRDAGCEGNLQYAEAVSKWKSEHISQPITEQIATNLVHNVKNPGMFAKFTVGIAAAKQMMSNGLQATKNTGSSIYTSAATKTANGYNAAKTIASNGLQATKNKANAALTATTTTTSNVYNAGKTMAGKGYTAATTAASDRARRAYNFLEEKTRGPKRDAIVNGTTRAYNSTTQAISTGKEYLGQKVSNGVQATKNTANMIYVETAPKVTTGYNAAKTKLAIGYTAATTATSNATHATYNYLEEKTRGPKRDAVVNATARVYNGTKQVVSNGANATYNYLEERTRGPKRDAVVQAAGSSFNYVNQKMQSAGQWVSEHNPFSRNAQPAAQAQPVNPDQGNAAPVLPAPQPAPQPQLAPQLKPVPAIVAPQPAPAPTDQLDTKKQAPLRHRLMTNPLTYVTTAVAIPVMLAVVRMAQLVTKPAAITDTIKKLDQLIALATAKTEQALLVDGLNDHVLAAINNEKYAQLQDYAQKDQLEDFVKTAREYKNELTTTLAPATSMFSKEAIMKVFKKIEYGVKADFAAAKKWFANKISCAKTDKAEAQRA